jgi:hypothetical protein
VEEAVILDGIFQCILCHGTKTDLRVVKNVGLVCIDEKACQLIREMDDGGNRVSS